MSAGYYALQDVEGEEQHNSSKPCPEDNANWASKLTYWWTQKLLFQGYKKPLEQHDLFQLPPHLDSQLLADQLVIDWDKKRPLVRAYLKCFLSRFWFVPIIRFFALLCVFVNPFLLRTLIGAVKSGTTALSGSPVFTNAWQVVVALFLSTVLKATLDHRGYWTGLNCGLSARGATMGVVYRKALKMGLAGKRQGHSTGTVTNMIAVDADAVLFFFWNAVHDIYLTPFSIIVLLTLVCIVVGPAGILGFITMVAAVPLNVWFTRSATKFKSKAREFADQRVRLVNEVLQGIRLLKLYHWEYPFRSRIEEIRNSQAAQILASQRRALWTTFVSALMPGTVLSVTFAAYVYFGHTLDAQVAFTSLALFQSLKAPLGQLPSSVNFLSQFLIAANRLESFLRVDEVQTKHAKVQTSENGEIIIENGEFWWDEKEKEEEEGEIELVKGNVNIASSDIELDVMNDVVNLSNSSAVIEMTDDEEIGNIGEDNNNRNNRSNSDNSVSPPLSPSSIKPKPALSNVFFRAPAGKLTCVVGSVGSGKTTLLHAILREINPSSGNMVLPNDIAYTPQSAWLLTATLRDNILFGREMDTKRYNEVLKACALVKDLKLLPQGDLTEIGEQGINLSGGQKQRVSLARAVYANPKCYILDEPLSAVDAHVATWLFDACVQGMMAQSTRVLVTHQLQFLPMADSIVVLHQGKITHTGTYAELVNQGIDFETLVKKKFEGKTENEKDSTPDLADGQTTSPEAEDLAAHDQAQAETQEETQEREKEEEREGGEGEGEKAGGIISKEERQSGQVDWRIYKDYFAASGPLWRLFATLIVYVVAQVSFLVSEYWLVLWTAGRFDFGHYTYITVFFAMILFYALVKRIGTVLVQGTTHKSAKNLHENLLSSVLSATASFFDMTPTGRIINRFSKDQDVLDNNLPHAIQDCFECGVIVLCSITLICILTPLFVLPLIGLVFLYYHVQKFYRRTSREIKRLESISRSPIFSCFSESMSGLTTIRAFKRQDDFVSVINKRVSANQKTIFYEFCCNRWLGVRLEWIASCVVLFSASFAIISMKALGPGLVGLLISTTLAFSGNLNWVVRQFTDLEVQMNAVERILHYIRTTPQETTPEGAPRPPASWPHDGAIDIKDLVIRYREDLDPVLRGITCSIRAGEKIGIVGRTGAGKSTLTTAIFRMVEASSGSISIDGVDISSVGLDVLRSRISIIPQEPVLFSGSIRMNLDPFLKASDTDLWEALRRVHLKDHVASIPGQLDYTVQESGEGFSVGQRQLLCLGRALLRKTKVLVMDEATASLDFNTDTLIKATVRECFAANTLITIAHRLDTILDSDRVMVFEAGKISEFDSPSALLSNPTSKFFLLVEAARQAATR